MCFRSKIFLKWSKMSTFDHFDMKMVLIGPQSRAVFPKFRDMHTYYEIILDFLLFVREWQTYINGSPNLQCRICWSWKYSMSMIHVETHFVSKFQTWNIVSDNICNSFNKCALRCLKDSLVYILLPTSAF